MKKTLLSLGLAALSFGIFSQTDCVTTEGFNDNYSGATAPVGIYYWGDTKDDVTNQEPSFSWVRNSGALDITVDHALIVGSTTDYNIWAPMGIDINTADEGASTAIYIDATNNKAGSVTVSNPGTDDIEIYFTLLSNGATGDAARTTNAHVDGSSVTLFGGVVAAGGSATYSMDLTNGKTRTWVADEAACTTMGGTLVNTNDCITDKNFDVSEISGLEWSINGAASAASSWQNTALDGAVVSLSEFTVGVACTTTGLEDNASAAGFEVYPNPAQDVVNFNYTVNGAASVELSNSLGSVVSSTEGTSMNVADLPAGVYFATLNVNGVATAVQRVQVQ